MAGRLLPLPLGEVSPIGDGEGEPVCLIQKTGDYDTAVPCVSLLSLILSLSANPPAHASGITIRFYRCLPTLQPNCLESLSDFRCQPTSGVTSAFLVLLYGITSKKATPFTSGYTPPSRGRWGRSIPSGKRNLQSGGRRRRGRRRRHCRVSWT